MIQSYRHINAGTTIINVLVSIAIFGLLIASIAAFQVSVFQQQKINETRAEVDQKTIFLMRAFTEEVRTAQQSSEGSYPIATATDTEFTFYSDLDNDGLIERVRYTRNNDTIEKGIIIPTGNPLSYIPGNETVQTIAIDVSANPIFSYFDATYNGVDIVDPLTFPITIADIRSITISYQVAPSLQGVAPTTIETHVTLRNLRDV